VLVAAVAARHACALMRPEHAMRASTHDNDPRNDGSTDAPQVRHTVHASITQADAIGGPMAKADTLTCSSVSVRMPKRSKTRTCTHHHHSFLTPNDPLTSHLDGEEGGGVRRASCVAVGST
jgi:hypothetical protein